MNEIGIQEISNYNAEQMELAGMLYENQMEDLTYAEQEEVNQMVRDLRNDLLVQDRLDEIASA